MFGRNPFLASIVAIILIHTAGSVTMMLAGPTWASLAILTLSLVALVGAMSMAEKALKIAMIAAKGKSDAGR